MRHWTRVFAGLCAAIVLMVSAAPAAAKKPAARPEPAQARGEAKGEAVAISGRVAVGLDKAFIKDVARGYLMVQGVDLTRHAGKHVEARGVLLGREQDYQVVRLTDYRVRNPDDDSPGAGGAVRPGAPSGERPRARGGK